MQTNKTSFCLSPRPDLIRPSCVRQIMTRLNTPETILFTAGLPDPTMFPAQKLSKAAASVLASSPHMALQYGTTQGLAPLRRYVAKNLLAPEGINAHEEEIIITNGSQQGLDLIARVLIDENSPVLVESPTYMAALQAFDLWKPLYLQTPISEGGVCPEKVNKILTAHKNTRLMYTVSSFHNPTGLSYSAQTAKRIAQVIEKHNTILVEDNPYRELFYGTRPAKLISAGCPEKAIVLGTFSKTLAPGLRIGWLRAPKQIALKLIKVKQGADLCSNVLSQHILLRYMEMFDPEEHAQNLRRAYRPKRDLFLEQLSREMPQGVSWTRPEGGMFVWLTLPENINASALLEQTLQHGVAFAPGESFFATLPQKNTIRLNFTHPSPGEIKKGLKVIARCIDKMMRKQPQGTKEHAGT